jgi:hypothetical protein
MSVGGFEAFFTLLLCSSDGRPILAEVFYDAIGDDTGLEFVEIYNPSQSTVSLAGLRLEAGDGSGPARWSLRWTGQAADSIAAGGRFLIGGDRVTPKPQAVTHLDLQNGPDAVRLVWPDAVIEVLGYGALEFPEYACGEPAADAPSGQSLARIPDDSNRGSNALDFRAGMPSPGRANQPERDIAWVPGRFTLDPEQPASWERPKLLSLATNRGSVTLRPGEATVRGLTRGPAGERGVFEPRPLPALAPGDSAWFETTLDPLTEGKQTLTLRLELQGDEAPENDVDSIRVRVGRGPVELTEIQFHPAHDEGEWVEVRNGSQAPVDLTTFTLSDRGSGRGRLTAGESVCDPESLAVLAQDRDGLIRHFPALDPRRVWQVTPWSSLNNQDDSAGIADIVVVREQDGTPSDHHGYSAAGVPAGVPIERRQGDIWTSALDPEGTPLRPPRLPPAIANRFTIAPRRLRAGQDRAHLSWSLPWQRGRLSAEVYDLSGARVAMALPEFAAPGHDEREWDLEGLLPGLYIIVLRARSDAGESLTASQWLRLEGPRP